MVKRAPVSIGDQVYAGEGTDPFGAVREVHAHVLIVNIEGAGDVRIPSAAVTSVHDAKIIVDLAQLPPEHQRAIKHAHDQEDR
jgi:hypothetical protein